MADYTTLFQEAGKAHNVDPQLLRAIVQVESGGNPNAVSEVGAQGAAQLMPATAKALGVKNAFDPRENIFGAAKLLDENLTRYGNANDAILAYHGGTDQKNWGPKTQAYLGKVTAAYQGQSKMPSTTNTLGEAGGNDDAFTAYFGGKASAAQPQGGDPFSQYFGNAGAAPVKTAAQAAPQQAPVQTGGQPVPGSFTMGLGDVVKGGVQSLVHGIGAAAERFPNALRALNFLTGGDINADVAKDFQTGTRQADQQIANQERAYEAARQLKGETGIDAMRLAGNLVGGAPLAAASPATAGLNLATRAGIGAGLGAAGSLISPVTSTETPYAEQKQNQALVGSLTGGAAVPATAALGATLRGVTDPVRQRLAAAGVTMTPGQLLGGALQRTEEKLTSVPVLGDLIKNAQQRSIGSFNRATYQDALDQVGETFPKNESIGSKGVAYVRDKIGSVYDSIVPRARFVMDQNFTGDLNAIRADLAQNAPGALQQFDNIVENQITKKLGNGVLNGDQWNNSRSTITGIARNRLAGNSTPDDRVLADALGDLTDALNAGVGRSSPSDVMTTLQRANAAWARYKQIERAAGSTGASNNGNIFTAAQFSSAARNQATAAQKATNSGLGGQLAADATDVLGSKYPDSGTVGRSLMTMLPGLAAGHIVAPSVVIPAAAGIGAASIPYTATGQRLAQALLLNRPQALRQTGAALPNYGARLGALLSPAALTQTQP